MKLYGKKRAIETLKRFKKSGRFPHALLILGENGIGRRTLAEYTAMLYLCSNSNEPCMACRECTRIESGIHPDVVYPLSLCKNDKYNIADLRAFIADCSQLPNDAETRVCIFERLDEMSVACQNALLKFIEEPLPFNRYIFTAEKKSAVLQTVISRVTELNCDECTAEELYSALSEKGIPIEESRRLYELYGGNIGAAIAAYENSAEASLNTTAAEICDAIADGREMDCLTGFTSLKTRSDIAKVLGILSDIYAKSAAKLSGAQIKGAFMPQIDKNARRLRLLTIDRLYTETSKLYTATDSNPNMKLFSAECCCRLFSIRES